MINTKEYYFVTGNVDRQIQDSPKIKWTLAVNSRKSVRTKIFLLQHMVVSVFMHGQNLCKLC